MINSLQSFRGIFAIFIFFHHYHFRDLNNIFPAGGDCGVAFFFILSGFVLCAGYQDRILERRITFKTFIHKRIIKLYPLHLLCFIWAWGLNRYSIPTGQSIQWLSNLFLIQSWIPKSSFYFSANAVGWCLSDIIFFYMAFPILIYLLNRYKRLSYVISFFVCLAWIGSCPYIPSEYAHAIIYISPLTRLLDFTIGIILYQIFQYIQIKKLNIVNYIRTNFFISTTIEISIVLLLVLFLKAFNYLPEYWTLSSYWWVPCGLIILIFSIKLNGLTSKIITLKPILLFGNISFTFYMVHVLGMTTCNIILTKLQLPQTIEFNLMSVLIFDSILAIIISKFIEKPVSNILKKTLIP